MDVPEGMPDIHSEEFKSGLIAHLMESMEKLRAVETVVRKMDKTTFDELTPELWAGFVGAVPAIMEQLQYVEATFRASSTFIDDEKAMDMVFKKVQEWES